MCRLFGFRGERAASLTCSLRDAENALIKQTRSASGDHRNADGWGIGFYENGRVKVHKHASAAFRDSHFGKITEGVVSTTILAHVRRSTVGTPTLENTHPFQWGPWLFAHNGTVEQFEVLRRDLLELIQPDLRGEIRGETDSEHCFYLFLTYLFKRADANSQELPREEAERALTEAIQQLEVLSDTHGASIRSRLNFLCSNGPLLLATRRGKGLYAIERMGILDREICAAPRRTNVQYGVENGSGHARSILIASEKITHEPAWQEIPDNSLLSVDEDLTVHRSPLS